MLKKSFLFFIAVTVFAVCLGGCGKDNGESTNETTKPSIATDELMFPEVADVVIPSIDEITYSDYQEMSADEQKAIINSFDSMDDFFDWHEEIKQEHKNESAQEATDDSSDGGLVYPEATDDSSDGGLVYPEATDVTAPPKEEMTFLRYHSLPAEEQKAFINSFGSIDAFFEWHTAAKKEYNDSLIGIGLDGKPIIETEPTTKD